MQYRQLQNTIFLAVRKAQITLEQDRARSRGAQARIWRNRATMKVKKYQLGSSSYNVVRGRDC